MSKNKGTAGILIGAALLGGYLLYKNSTAPKEKNGSGSLGGTDDLLEQQGFDIDPNAVPDQPQNDSVFYVIAPNGQLLPQDTEGVGTDGGTGIPSNVPIASTGTGTLFQDAAVVGGSIGSNLFLSSATKKLGSLVDTKYITKKVGEQVKPSWLKKIASDPYSSFDDLAVSKAEKTGSNLVAELALDTSGKTVIKASRKAALKTSIAWLPIIDVPINIAIDQYYSRKYDKPEDVESIWVSAGANIAGEFAQVGSLIGITAATGGIGTIPAFFTGAAVDIGTTEKTAQLLGSTSQQRIFTNPSASESSSSGSSSKSSPTSSNVTNVSKATASPVNNITKAISSAPSTNVSKTATTSSSATAAKTVTVTPKVSVISQVVMAPVKAVQSVVNKVSSVFKKK
jgi:hypothetical protein